MIFSDISTPARSLLNDGSAQNWSDAELLAYLRLIMLDIRNQRGDAILDANGDVLSWSEPATTGTLALPDKFTLAVVHGVCWHAFEKDYGDPKHVAMAQQHREEYLALVKR